MDHIGIDVHKKELLRGPPGGLQRLDIPKSAISTYWQ